MEPGLVDRLTHHPLQVHLAPGSIAWQGEKLVVTPLVLYASHDVYDVGASEHSQPLALNLQSSQDLPISRSVVKDILPSQVKTSSQICQLQERSLITSQSSNQLRESESLSCSETQKEILLTSQFKDGEGQHCLASRTKNGYLQFEEDMPSTHSDEQPKTVTNQRVVTSASVEESRRIPMIVTAQIHRVSDSTIPTPEL